MTKETEVALLQAEIALLRGRLATIHLAGTFGPTNQAVVERIQQLEYTDAQARQYIQNAQAREQRIHELEDRLPHPGLGSGALREALAKRAEELHIRMNYSGLPDDKPYSDCLHFTFERCTSKACREARALLSLSSPIEPRERELESLIVHMWVHSGYTKNGYQQMTTPQKALYDSLVGRSEEIAERDMPPTAVMRERAQASSEIREVIESIAQEMCALATEKHHSADGYAYEKLGKYGRRILDALPPSRQGAAKRVEG